MYFEKKGIINTERTVEVSIKTAAEQNINHIVVASKEGYTASLFKGCAPTIICVTHPNGYINQGINEMSLEKRRELESSGIIVLTTSLLFGGVDRGLRNKFQGVYTSEIMSNTLKLFGQGVKVCIEIAIMALDAGLLPYGEDIIAVAGTRSGADTAIIIRPAHASNMFDTFVSQILCKPK